MTAQDLLQEAAAIAYDEAPRACTVNPATGRNCVLTHRLWPTLRLLGLAASAELHAPLLQQALRRALDRVPGAPSILISGASDFALLAIVLAALGGKGERAGITVVDRCATPLLLNRWYARKVGREIETRCVDILALQHTQAFDIVCTHSFLGFFAPPEREHVVAKWLQLLRPGGHAVTVNRIRADPARAAGFSPEDAERFERAVLRKAAALEDRLPASAAAIAALAREQAGLGGKAYPVRSPDELRGLFERAGFRVEGLACEALPVPAQSGIWGLGVPGDAPYALLIAQKPEAG